MKMRGRNEDALRLSQQAIFLAREASTLESLYRWQWQAARLLHKQGEQHASLDHYRQAIASLDQIRSEFLMQASTSGGCICAQDSTTLPAVRYAAD